MKVTGRRHWATSLYVLVYLNIRPFRLAGHPTSGLQAGPSLHAPWLTDPSETISTLSTLQDPTCPSLWSSLVSLPDFPLHIPSPSPRSTLHPRLVLVYPFYMHIQPSVSTWLCLTCLFQTPGRARSARPLFYSDVLCPNQTQKRRIAHTQISSQKYKQHQASISLPKLNSSVEMFTNDMYPDGFQATESKGTIINFKN